MQVVLLELNEINFEFVQAYCRAGALPAFARLIAAHGVQHTTSETRYEELEPWIQWVTARTGLSLSEHKVFRLGDIVRHPVQQIYEALEDRGLTIGAVSPINAANRLRNPAFFIADPWTQTRTSGSALVRAFASAVARAVHDNAQGRIGPRDLAAIAGGALRFARPRNYAAYLRLAATARTRPWRRAAFLDLLLGDMFIDLMQHHRPDFASLFVNAGAHTQHHYLFNAAVYDGPHRNPSWYVRPDDDPVLEILQLYDGLIADLQRSFPDVRLLIATGLHQDAHPQVTYYYRLKAHAELLRLIDAPFVRVEPRMSRDFYIACKDARDATACAAALRAVTAADGTPMFTVDLRGDDLFVEMTYPHEIGRGFAVTSAKGPIAHFDRMVAFVAIKNGQHNGLGYFIDCGAGRLGGQASFPLKDLRGRIESLFGAASEVRPRQAA